MKLTDTNPEILDLLVDIPSGVLPVRRGGDLRMMLIVKATKEYALATKLRRAFRFYTVPLHIDGVPTYGLLAAFFDDDDEPLVIRTPLFHEEITQDFLSLLSSDTFSVHFFDDHNRELAGFRAENPNAGRFRALSSTFRFVPATLARTRQSLDEMQFWFGDRSTSDDEAALTIHLGVPLFPDSLAEHVDNPGDSNELDVATALLPAFGEDQVLSNPVRAENGREFVDVLVATAKYLLLIQAKDSPNTQLALDRRIRRKMATSAKHIKKATGQLKGSIDQLRAHESIEITMGGHRRNVSLADRDVFGLVIVKEVFDSERLTCSRPVLELFEDTGTPCVLLDYVEFRQLAFFRRSEDAFVGALWDLFSAARAHDLFPRSRFGLRTDEAVVYEPRKSPKAGASTIIETPGSASDPRYTTTPPVESPTCHAAGFGLRENLRAEWLNVVVDRTEVAALGISRTARILSGVLANRNAIECYCGRVDVAFSGFAGDRRELYEIPEIRRFVAKLDAAFPYWFYFLSTESATLGVVSSCLCSVSKLSPGMVMFGPDLVEFMTRHFEALNWLFDNYSLDEADNVEISRNVAKYFGEFEAIP